MLLSPIDDETNISFLSRGCLFFVFFRILRCRLSGGWIIVRQAIMKNQSSRALHGLACLLNSIFYVLILATLVHLINMVGVWIWGLDFVKWIPWHGFTIAGVSSEIRNPFYSFIYNGVSLEYARKIPLPLLKELWLKDHAMVIARLILIVVVVRIAVRMVKSIQQQAPFTRENVRRLQIVGLILLFDVLILDLCETLAFSPLRDALNAMGDPNIKAEVSFYYTSRYAFLSAFFVLALSEILRRGIVLREEHHELQNKIYQKQKLEAIGTLAGGITHDFNNILTVLVGYADLLQEKAKDGPLAFPASQILDSCHRAKRLIQQLKEFGRQDLGAAHMDLLDLDHEIDEFLESVRPMVPANVTLKRETATNGPWHVMADPVKLYQVFLNLAVNAFEAMKDRGGSLTFALDSSQESGLPMCRISVTDEGKGMDPETMERVFEPYFTTRSAEGNTGLGLSVAYGIVNAHRGSISVESTPGVGTTFSLLLPQTDGQVDAAPPAEPQEAVPGVAARLLVVDDDPAVRQMLQMRLTQIGYRVTLSPGSLDAWSRIMADPSAFDLVLTDLSMPGEDGRALAVRIRDAALLLPVVCMTGRIDPLSETKDEQFDAVVSKPLSMTELTGVLRGCLDKKTQGLNR